MPCLQALPVGTETDFILVGCAGVKGSVAGADNGTEDNGKQLEKMVAAKRRGEAYASHASEIVSSKTESQNKTVPFLQLNCTL